VAGPPSALDLSLHPDFGVLAQRGRGVLCQTHPPPAQTGVFHSFVDLQAAINRYLAEHNHSPKPFTWTADPNRIIAAASRGYQVLDSILPDRVLCGTAGANSPQPRHERNRAMKRDEENRGLQRTLFCGKFGITQLFCFRNLRLTPRFKNGASDGT
jgi:hypothetical protein